MLKCKYKHNCFNQNMSWFWSKYAVKYLYDNGWVHHQLEWPTMPMEGKGHNKTMMRLNDSKKNSWVKDTMYLQHLSQKNLSSAFRVSVELKFLRQLVIELFCSMSRLRSKNVSSLAVTVSQRKHLVSLVRIPCMWKDNDHKLAWVSAINQN